MLTTAKYAGIYQSKYMSQSWDKILIVTIGEIWEDKKRWDIKLSFEFLKSAEKQKVVKSTRLELEF